MNNIQKFLEIFIFILFIVMVVSGFAQVVSRSIFHKSFIWSEELCRYSGIWLVMLTTAIAFKDNQHIGLDFFLMKFPVKIRKVIVFINYVLMIFVMGWFAAFTCVLIIKTGRNQSPALSCPMGVIYMSMVLCGILSVIFIIYSAIKYYFYPNEGAEVI